MITALLGILIAQLAGITGLKFWTRRTQRQAELRRWAPFRQNPIIDPLLRKYAGELHGTKKRWAAAKLKATTRNFVNSEAFSIAVDGLINSESTTQALREKLPTAIKLGWNSGETKLGGLHPQDASFCTIH